MRSDLAGICSTALGGRLAPPRCGGANAGLAGTAAAGAATGWGVRCRGTYCSARGGACTLTVPGRCGRGSIEVQLSCGPSVGWPRRTVQSPEMATRRTRSLSRNVPFVLP